MLRFNGFRPNRYLRSKFVEGRYLLAFENEALELEMLDLMRKEIQNTFGDIAIGDAWKVEMLSSNEVLLKTGIAYYKGLPFEFRFGKDQLVDTVVPGILAAGVSLSDHPDGLGKIITFTQSTTPTGSYTIVLEAREQTVTSVDDPFLKNANIPESTANKSRLIIRINIVLSSDLDESPQPYTNDLSDENLVNQIVVTPTNGVNGYYIQESGVPGAEIDGRDLEIIVRNHPTDGGGNPIPNGLDDQRAFFNGTLIDSQGSLYHLNAIFNDTDTNNVVLRIDLEVGQAHPQIIDGEPYTLIKRDVYVSDDNTGQPLGRLFYPVADVDWNMSSEITHESKIIDLRTKIIKQDEIQAILAKRPNLKLSGGQVHWDFDTEEFTLLDDVELAEPETGLINIIEAGTFVMMDGGSLAYRLSGSGGIVSLGNLAVNVDSNASNVATLSSIDLSAVRIGNVVKRDTDITYITAIDNVNSRITLDSSFTGTGAATIYLDSFAAGYSPIGFESYVLAIRKIDRIFAGSVVIVDKETASIVASGTSGSGSGVVKATLYDPISTSLPAGANPTIDGITLLEEDLVFFTNLNTNNERIYRATNVATSVVWTVQPSFANFSETPVAGDSVRVLKGNLFESQVVYLDDNGEYKINDTIRLFDGDKGTDYWELGSLKTTTLTNDTVDGVIFSVEAANSDNWIINYSILRDTDKETGQLYITSNGTDVKLAVNNSYIGEPGVIFDVQMNGGDLELLYTTTNTGNDALMKFFTSRWSDAPGGPSGVPSYSGGSSTTLAAGNTGEIQYKGIDGNLAADSKFHIDPVDAVVSLDGLEITTLKSETLLDNQAAPITAFSYPDTILYAVIEYSLDRDGDRQLGTILITHDSSAIEIVNNNIFTTVTGITFSAILAGGNVELQYTSTSTGDDALMKYSMRRWS